MVAAHEPASHCRKLFNDLAEAADGQARIWAQSIGDHAFRPRWRARIIARLIKTFGPRALRPALVAMKLRGFSVYDAPSATAGHDMPQSLDDIGRRHHGMAGSNNLRAAVFGVNDGLISNTSLIIGVVGAGASGDLVLTSGVAGLLAGALSMAAGEYVSVRSQREMYEHQIALERAELAQYPTEEAEELALIYQARGLELGQARELARKLVSNPERALEALARDELGINPHDLASPWGAARSSFLSFAVGAAIPLVPFLLRPASPVPWVITLAALALFAVGATLSLFNGGNALRGGLRMLLIGAGAAGCTWLLGRLFNVAIN